MIKNKKTICLLVGINFLIGQRSVGAELTLESASCDFYGLPFSDSGRTLKAETDLIKLYSNIHTTPVLAFLISPEGTYESTQEKDLCCQQHKDVCLHHACLKCNPESTGYFLSIGANPLRPEIFSLVPAMNVYCAKKVVDHLSDISDVSERNRSLTVLKDRAIRCSNSRLLSLVCCSFFID
jgi:hypothetical protein